MDGLLATPRVLEIGFDLLSAAAGLFVVAMALRVASEFIGIAAALRGAERIDPFPSAGGERQGR